MYAMILDGEEATWIRKLLGDYLPNERSEERRKEEDKKTYRGRTATTIIQKYQNSYGRVVKIWKLTRGVKQIIMVSEDVNCRGWVRFHEALDFTSKQQ